MMALIQIYVLCCEMTQVCSMSLFRVGVVHRRVDSGAEVLLGEGRGGVVMGCEVVMAL